MERALYDRLYFFKDTGEGFATSLQRHKRKWFARPKEEGVRYGQIMAEYRDITGASSDAAAQPPVFMPFAGTEGYNPAAYLPYILGAGLAVCSGSSFRQAS